MMLPIQGKMFRMWREYDAFWDYGVGAMSWAWVKDKTDAEDFEGRRALFVLVPHKDVRRPFVPVQLYVDRAPDNWAEPGNVRGWDGDEERPTFTPSVQVLPRDTGWHGFIERGMLITA